MAPADDDVTTNDDDIFDDVTTNNDVIFDDIIYYVINPLPSSSLASHTSDAKTLLARIFNSLLFQLQLHQQLSNFRCSEIFELSN